jgi:hypothetical protein
MYGIPSSSFVRKFGISLAAATLTLCAASPVQADEPTPDDSLTPWIGREFTILSSTINDHMPTGAKLTFVFDSDENVVRVCTRDATSARGRWRADFAVPCGVTLTFTRGTRYCTVEDVKAGNGEVLSQCHRLRSRDVVMRPERETRGVAELNDMIVFLVRGEAGKRVISVLVDSPSRVTGSGIIVGQG